jgi:hypothetical protein
MNWTAARSSSSTGSSKFQWSKFCCETVNSTVDNDVKHEAIITIKHNGTVHP